MHTRTAFFLAMLIGAGQPIAAEPAALDHCRGGEGLSLEHAPGRASTWSTWTRPALVMNADSRARELRKIASYAAVGNRTEVEIRSRELRELGVSADELRDAAAQMWPSTHLRGSPAPESATRAEHGS